MRFLILLTLTGVWMLGAAHAQERVVPTTTYTRGLLTNSTAVSARTYLGAGASTNGTYSGGTFTGATNINPTTTGGTVTGGTNSGLTYFGTATITNAFASRVTVNSNFTALGNLRAGSSSEGNTLGNGDIAADGQLYTGGAGINAGYVAAFNWQTGSLISAPEIWFDNRTATNSNMLFSFASSGTRRGYVGWQGSSSSNNRKMAIVDSIGDGMILQTGSGGGQNGWMFYSASLGNYAMKLHALGGLAIGSSYYSTAPATNGMNVEGKVGLAVTSPQYQLDVGGTVRLTGTNTIWFGGTSGAADGNVGLYNVSSGRLLHTGSMENVGNMNVGFYGAGSIANFHVKGAVMSAPMVILGCTGNTPTNDFLQIQINGTNKFTVDKNLTINQNGTITTPGTTGAQTINKPVGSVNLAAAATSLVVTNSAVGSATDTIVLLTVGSNDTTTKSCSVVVGTGQFTIYPNAAPTAETVVFFNVIKIK